MLLLDIIVNHVWDAPSDLTLSDLERSKSKSSIVYPKGGELSYMLLLNINSKSYRKSTQL